MLAEKIILSTSFNELMRSFHLSVYLITSSLFESTSFKSFKSFKMPLLSIAQEFSSSNGILTNLNGHQVLERLFFNTRFVQRNLSEHIRQVKLGLDRSVEDDQRDLEMYLDNEKENFLPSGQFGLDMWTDIRIIWQSARKGKNLYVYCNTSVNRPSLSSKF